MALTYIIRTNQWALAHIDVDAYILFLYMGDLKHSFEISKERAFHIMEAFITQ